jgi:hypothetical protein
VPDAAEYKNGRAVIIYGGGGDDEEGVPVAAYAFTRDKIGDVAGTIALPVLNIQDVSELKVDAHVAEFLKDVSDALAAEQAAKTADRKSTLVDFVFLNGFGEGNSDLAAFYGPQLKAIADKPTSLGPEVNVFIGDSAQFGLGQPKFEIAYNSLFNVITPDPQNVVKDLTAFLKEKQVPDDKIALVLEKLSITPLAKIKSGAQYRAPAAQKVFTGARLASRTAIEDLPSESPLVIGFFTNAFAAVKTVFNGSVAALLAALKKIDPAKYDNYRDIFVKASPINIDLFMRVVKNALVQLGSAA